MQLWDSREDLERFNRETFGPIMAALGGRGFPKPPVVHDIDTVMAWVGQQQI